jgi:glycosyltransferase involved in cell wall biosynthesis
MRVLVDFTQIPADRTGVGVYAENLVRELALQLSGDDTLFLLVQKDEERIREVARGRANVVIVPLTTGLWRNRALLMLYEQFVMPWLLLRNNIDVVHSLHYTHPLISPCARVVTIHDLTFLRFPELHTTGRRWIMPFFIKRAVRHAEGLVFVSQVTSNDTEKLIPSTNQSVRRVIPHGVNAGDFQVAADWKQEVLDKLSILSPFLLFVGTLEPRKNVVRLIQAFEQFASRYPELLLIIAGKPGWNFEDIFTAMKATAYRERIRHLGFVSEPEKKALLAACEILIYPSLYEGFGLPVLEAMAAGAPVITSNVSSLPEVAGDAAVLIDPLSVEEISGAMQAILDNPVQREELVRKGRDQAARFSWARAAAQTLDTYRKVAKPASR